LIIVGRLLDCSKVLFRSVLWNLVASIGFLIIIGMEVRHFDLDVFDIVTEMLNFSLAFHNGIIDVLVVFLL